MNEETGNSRYFFCFCLHKIGSKGVTVLVAMLSGRLHTSSIAANGVMSLFKRRYLMEEFLWFSSKIRFTGLGSQIFFSFSITHYTQSREIPLYKGVSRSVIDFFSSTSITLFKSVNFESKVYIPY